MCCVMLSLSYSTLYQWDHIIKIEKYVYLQSHFPIIHKLYKIYTGGLNYESILIILYLYTYKYIILCVFECLLQNTVLIIRVCTYTIRT